jgi:hypothetical protein
MPDLYHTFLNHDIGHLRVVADSWGFELESTSLDSAADELSASLLDPAPVRETIDILSPDARSAVIALVDSSGKIEWAAFSRKFGSIREVGAAKRDRERPYLKPASVAEVLFYRGLLDKAFFDTDTGAQEFAFIPDDLLQVIQDVLTPEINEVKKSPEEAWGRPATPVEKSFEYPATDQILDDATTLLAALRIGYDTTSFGRALPELLTCAALIKKNALQAESVKNFLGAPRSVALNLLYSSWKDSKTFNELRQLPHLNCEGEWSNDALATRHFLLNLLQDIPRDKWWSIPAFVRTIKEKRPDFQRPAGDYDSWFIKRVADNQFLRGFAYWDEVDGALVKYVLSVLHMLGRVDLASPEEGREITAFRVKSSLEKKDEKGKIVAGSNGRITVSRLFSRAIRYQIARFCEWDEPKGDDYLYRVTAKSLKRAVEQGLKAEQLLVLLVKHTGNSVPPPLVKALKRWDVHGTEARLETHIILKLASPEALDELRRSKASRFLGETLSPTTVIVKSGAEDKILAALAELGLFAEVL